MKTKWINVGENLIRNRESGKYYVRLEHGGRDVWKSLKTDKITVARLRKDDVMAQIRAKGSDSLTRDNLTMGECAVVYLQGKRDEKLEPSAYKYCERSVIMLRTYFKGFDAKLVEDFTPQDCKVLTDRLRANYSARRFNGTLWALRAIIEVAKKAKVIKENPAMEIKPEKIHHKNLDLPAEEKIELVMQRLRHQRWPGKDGAEKGPLRTFDSFLFVTLMVESGQRIGSIRLLRPEHINLKRGTVTWLPFKHAKMTDVLPMTRKMKAVFRLLLRKHTLLWGQGVDKPLLPIRDPRRALQTVCKSVGIDYLSSHKWRHICSTRMAERNVPYALAAKWRRDTDGGGTFMKVYVHPRHESMREVVKALERREAEPVIGGKKHGLHLNASQVSSSPKNKP